MACVGVAQWVRGYTISGLTTCISEKVVPQTGTLACGHGTWMCEHLDLYMHTNTRAPCAYACACACGRVHGNGGAHLLHRIGVNHERIAQKVTRAIAHTLAIEGLLIVLAAANLRLDL